MRHAHQDAIVEPLRKFPHDFNKSDCRPRQWRCPCQLPSRTLKDISNMYIQICSPPMDNLMRCAVQLQCLPRDIYVHAAGHSEHRLPTGAGPV